MLAISRYEAESIKSSLSWLEQPLASDSSLEDLMSCICLYN